MIERVEPSSFVAAGDPLSVHLSSSRITACPADTTTATHSFSVPVEEPAQLKRDSTSLSKEAEKLELEAWLGFRNFTIWRMNFRSEVSSCASRSIETMMWINEIESAKSIDDLKTTCAITGAKLQTNCEVLDSKMASGLKKIINGDFKRRVFNQKRRCTESKTLSHWKASRVDDLRPLPDEQHGRVCLGHQ